jgi:hypothetical protein
MTYGDLLDVVREVEECVKSDAEYFWDFYSVESKSRSGRLEDEFGFDDDQV